jgi:cobalamin biosynthesis protein CobT
MSVTIGELKSALHATTEKLLNSSKHLKFADLKVTFRGKTAGVAYSISGGWVSATLNFPYMPDDASISRGEADRMIGYAIHEDGHILFTDFDVFKRYSAQSKLHGAILNGIEDARMERCVIASGWAGNSRRCLEVLVGSVAIEALQSGYNPNDSKNIAFTLALLGREACGIKVSESARLWKMLSPKNAAWMRKAVAKIAKLPGGYAGTTAAAKLADQLIASLPQSQREQGEQGEQGEKREHSKQAERAEQGAEGEKAPDGEQCEGEQSGSEQGGDAFTRDEQQSDPEVNGAMDKLAEKMMRGRGQEHALADKLSETYVAPKPRAISPKGDASAFKRSVAKAGAFGLIKSKLSQMLVCPDEGGWEDRQTSGRFDARRVCAAKSGREDSFARRWEKEGYETAVLLMIDLSGSMGRGEGSRRLAAQHVACAFAEVFDKIGVPFEAYGYTTSGGNATALDVSRGLHGASGATEVNYDYAQIYCFKRRDQSVQEARKTLSTIGDTPGGGTPDYPAMRFAVETMMPLPARRKVVFNITDGDGCGAPAMKSLVALGKTRNVDLVGIGLQLNRNEVVNFTEQYELSAVVNDVSKLSHECFSLLLKQFEKYQSKLGREVM